MLHPAPGGDADMVEGERCTMSHERAITIRRLSENDLRLAQGIERLHKEGRHDKRRAFSLDAIGNTYAVIRDAVTDFPAHDGRIVLPRSAGPRRRAATLHGLSAIRSGRREKDSANSASTTR